MKRMVAPIAVTSALLLIGDTAALAANKEQQILMAELRIMQQHQQQLQQMVATLAETLKAVNGRLDEQAATSRKALADQRLLIEGVTESVRVLREKADDTNVRLSSMTQEIDTMRQTIAALPSAAPVGPAVPAGEPSTDPAGAGTSPTTVAPAIVLPPRGVSAQQTYDTAYSDYTGGQYELAVLGFQTFLKFFPRHPSADDAQLNVGNSLYNAGKFSDAVREYQKVIADYPKTETVPEAYYKLGVTYAAMKQYDLARKAFETVTKSYESSSYSALANQALGRLPKQD
jgi:tol-pal system protein YbgF